MRDPVAFTIVIPFDFVLALALLLLIALTGIFFAIRKLDSCIAALDRMVPGSQRPRGMQ